MIKLILIVFFFSLSLFAQDVRQERHDEAVKALSGLNFFYKGRGMAITPNLVNIYHFLSQVGVGTEDRGSLNRRWGLQLQDNKVKGLFTVPYEGMNMGVLGCVACHSGKAAGEYIVGLGNKNIDVGQIGSDASMAMKIWGLPPRLNPKFREIHNRALDFTKRLSDEKMANLTQGLVSVALVRSWFFRVQNIPVPQDGYRGQVKVPHFWGYGEKRKSGSFWDGEANGELGGWAIAVELFAGQTPENVREFYPKVHAAEDILADLLPPKYPFKIDAVKAEKGEKIFLSTCVKCHGNYQRDLQGYPIYESPKHVPLRVVKTDPERLNVLTPEWFNTVATNPLNDVLQYQSRYEPGYVAPKLWGIWSRFPYLHNASVPTLYDLLSSPEARPKKFSLKNAGEKERFDEVKLGLTPLYQDDHLRRLYDTARQGHSNQGHYFESFKNLTHENKIELIEYLKTL
jgi:mono/diheme cytochrome c family protein